MSSVKVKQNDVCGDCGAVEPTWASLNRGIHLCVQCCCAHRSLGSHISRVKSLQKSQLRPSQLATLETLSSFANNIWEHILLENGSKFAKRKPTPDETMSVKSAYILLKHQKLTYAFQQNKEDGLLCIESELGKQLHASVRTNKLEISFRLLTQGADPNYFHDEKGTTPLHNAVKAKNIQQCELLIIFGADPTFPDSKGLTPIDYAKEYANKDIVQRLIECQYEITDKFSYYLWHKKPDHQSGVHFLLKECNRKTNKECVLKLRSLPNHLFEELVMDVYDEVERREIEALWMGSAETSVVQCDVPFLPVDPRLSTTRNQSRQKLGRFSSPELMTLVYDILVDTQRRQIASDKDTLATKGSQNYSRNSDDDPLYDSVAEDDDYATVCSSMDEADANCFYDSKSLNEPSRVSANDSKLELLTRKLYDSDNTISHLKSEVSNLKMLVQQLNSENKELKSRLSQTPSSCDGNGAGGSVSYSPTDLQKPTVTNGCNNTNELETSRKNKLVRPSSMYETREGIRTPNWHLVKTQMKQMAQQNRNVTQSLYDNTPDKGIITQCTNEITKAIQRLCFCLKNKDLAKCMSCADTIKSVVMNLENAIPVDNVHDIAKQMWDFSSRLQMNCACLQTVTKANDAVQAEYYLSKVRECAYEIAKGTKEIVTKYS